MEEQESSQRLEDTRSNRVARIPVSLTLLEHMLPVGTQILGVKFHECYHTVDLIVSHPSFDPLLNGEPIPTKMVLLHKESHEDHSWVSKVEYA